MNEPKQTPNDGSREDAVTLVPLGAVIEGLEMTSDEMTVYLDRQTGEAYPLMDEALRAVADGEDPSAADWEKEHYALAASVIRETDRYVKLPERFDFNEWDMMRDFAAFQEGNTREQLLKAVHGSGAFSRFRSGIDRMGLRDAWFDYRDCCFRKIAVDWCEENNVKYDEESDE